MTRNLATIERTETANEQMLAGVARIERGIGLNTIGIIACGIMAVAIETMPIWTRH